MTTGVALVTALVGVLGAMIAYFQWRTAHQRVVLDLFDRRLRVFEDIENAVRNVFSTTRVSNETWSLLVGAKSRARFLFGKDVNDYLERLTKDFAWRMSFTDDVIDHDPQERPALLAKKYEVLERIVAFPKDGEPIFAPYMRLDQKMPGAWLPS